MRTVKHSVMVSADKAKGFTFEGKFTDLPHGVQYNSEKDAYVITGDRVVLQAADLISAEAVAEVNKRLANDLGELGRDSGDGESSKGTPVDLVYVCNNGGLALNYGEAIKAKHRVQQGRQTVVDIGQAVAWCAANKPELLSEAGTPEGRQAILAAWNAR